VTATLSQLRHSRASQLLQSGVSVPTVRHQLGHRNIHSTYRYRGITAPARNNDVRQE